MEHLDLPAHKSASGMVKLPGSKSKVLGRGDLASAKTIRAHAFSGSAVKKIEAKGGKALTIGKD